MKWTKGYYDDLHRRNAAYIFSKYSEETKREFIYNLTIYEFNIDKIFEEFYNGGEKYKFIALLNADKKQLDKLCKGDKLMFKFKEEIVDLNWESQFSKYMTTEEDHEKVLNTLLENAQEEGSKQGSKQEKVNIAKEMLKDKVDIETIAKYTNLSVKQINALK